MSEFAVTTSASSGWDVVAVRGEVDVMTAPQLRSSILGLVDAGSRRVVVDLAATSFMDSTGLGALVGCLRRINSQGGELRLAAARPAITRVFEVTKLTTVLPLHESVEAAVTTAAA